MEKNRFQKVEALLFIAPKPLSSNKIAEFTGFSIEQVEEAINELNRFYQKTERAFQIYSTPLGYQLRPNPEFSAILARLDEFKSQKLSSKALETLSVIAYKQPITRAEIEEVRGVDSLFSIESLLDRGLIRVLGRKDQIGKPILYGTSKHFLEVFGLRSLSELPELTSLED